MAPGLGEIPFVKMVAAGNVFMLVDGHGLPEPDWPTLARATADWHTGVGHDGLLVVAPSAVADVRQRMFNPDGSEDMCGNGLRCTAKYALDAGLTGERMTIETLVGLHRVESLGGRGATRHLRAEIGPARLSAITLPSDLLAELPDGASARLFVADVGTPHLVIPYLGAVDDETWQRLSARLEIEALPGERVTVTWYEPEGRDTVRARFWERAVGETFSCGTGAASILASARRLGLTRSTITVHARGGTLMAEVGEGDSLFVAGPATTLFTGLWPLGES